MRSANVVQTAPSVPVDPDLAGFMPKRGEFETEYDNDAEFLIKDMVFDEEDTPEEKGSIIQFLLLLVLTYSRTRGKSAIVTIVQLEVRSSSTATTVRFRPRAAWSEEDWSTREEANERRKRSVQ